MSGELEAAGAAVQAGLVAGAIERPGKGPAGKNRNTTGKCLNCDTPLAGAFCHACGQPAHISRTLGGLLHEFLNAFLSFDTKAWRTLPRLVMRPGTFTYEFIHGHRARYVSPLATFLFTVFVMFFVFSVVAGDGLPPGSFVSDAPQSRTETVAEAQAALTQAEQRRDAAHAALVTAQARAAEVEAEDTPGADGRAAGIVAGPEAAAEVADEAVDTAKENLADAQSRAERRERALAEASADLGKAKSDIQAVAPNAGVVVGAAKTAVDVAATRDAPGVNVKIDVKDGAAEDGDRPWQEELREALDSGDLKINTGYPQLDQRILVQLRNPDLALYKLQETASKFSFLLVPISLPFIALLFLWRRGVTFFDHVVFSLYSLSFMSLLFVALALLAKAGEWTTPIIGAVAAFVPPVHMFFHMGGTYKLGWWSALWRTSFLLFFILFVIVIFAASILALGLLS